jgi:hypothetical protein
MVFSFLVKKRRNDECGAFLPLFQSFMRRVMRTTAYVSSLQEHFFLLPVTSIVWLDERSLLTG